MNYFLTFYRKWLCGNIISTLIFKFTSETGLIDFIYHYHTSVMYKCTTVLRKLNKKHNINKYDIDIVATIIFNVYHLQLITIG